MKYILSPFLLPITITAVYFWRRQFTQEELEEKGGFWSEVWFEFTR